MNFKLSLTATTYLLTTHVPTVGLMVLSTLAWSSTHLTCAPHLIGLNICEILAGLPPHCQCRRVQTPQESILPSRPIAMNTSQKTFAEEESPMKVLHWLSMEYSELYGESDSIFSSCAFSDLPSPFCADLHPPSSHTSPPPPHIVRSLSACRDCFGLRRDWGR